MYEYYLYVIHQNHDKRIFQFGKGYDFPPVIEPLFFGCVRVGQIAIQKTSRISR